MADTRISALPAVAAELDADEFACNQAGVTKKESRAQIVSTITAALGTHVGVTAAPIHGSSVATANDALLHRGVGGDADATAFNAAAGAAGTPSHTFTADPNTGHYNYAADELGVATGGAHRAHWNTTGALILDDAAASTFMTGPGVTIQQGGYDDEAVTVKSTDVAHGITTWADTDTYFTLSKFEAGAGGAQLRGFKDGIGVAYGALSLEGWLGLNVDTDKTVAGRAIAEIRGFIKSGTTYGDTNADGNVFGVRTRRGGAEVTLLLVDEDADLHVLNDIVVAGVVDTIDVANHVHTGGAMGPLLTAAGITDRTRKFFVPVVDAYDATVPGHITDYTFWYGWELPDVHQCEAYGNFIVPSDFAAGLNVKCIVYANGNNIYRKNDSRYGACSEAYGIHTHMADWAAEATVNGGNACIASVNLVDASAGDIVRLMFLRDATNILDTINAAAWVIGWIVEYTADS